jgi:hypothetical protein
MKLKKQEFLALKQGTMSVSEYQDKFIQLARYAPADVADDEEKQDHFREVLIGPIKYQLMVHTFDSFEKMVDNAIMVEHAHKEMGEQKRKYESSMQSSNNVLASTPHKAHPSAQEDKMSTLGRVSTSASTNKLSTRVSQCSAPTFRRIARALLRAHQ